MPRPRRLRLPDFAGRPFTLPDDPASWQRLGPGAASALILGLGPHASGPPDISEGQVYWLESPDILAALPSSPPPQWRRVSPAEATHLAPSCAVYFYLPNLRLDPAFWQPLLGAIQWAVQKNSFAPANDRVWLPGSDAMLLHRDLRAALDGAYSVNTSLPSQAADLPRLWEGKLPRWALCVNFRGLDARGEIYSFCRAAHIPVAIWLVDNPWNLLSALSLPWWRDAFLFLTDPTFIPALKKMGARHAHFLPLAAAEHFFAAHGAGTGEPVFVGRSAFPHRDHYFAHCHLDQKLQDEAMALLQEGGRPDFCWWAERCPWPLWPGNGSRLPAFGAELCSQKRRSLWLEAALAAGLCIVGDADWQNLIPAAPVTPPVDYYGSLPGLYADALCCLNVTSLLLPGSLNQRHFDVWAAGGFLLTDWTDGLSIFPEELTRYSALAAREETGPRIRWLRAHEKERQELMARWRHLIREKHRYRHRIRQLEEILLGRCDHKGLSGG